MRHGRSTLVASVVTLLALVAAPRGQQAAEAPGGQATAAAKPSQPAPRTPDGRPDLQGTWPSGGVGQTFAHRRRAQDRVRHERLV